MIPSTTEPSTRSHTGIADDAPVMLGTDGADGLFGGVGSQLIAGLAGNDSLHGGVGNDELDGGSGDDQLYGEDGNDVLSGGPGRDFLVGGAGHNLLRGGAGADLYLVGESRSHDVIDNAVDAAEGDDDTIIFGAGISPDQLTLRRKDADLMICIPGRQSLVQVIGYFGHDGAASPAVSRIVFDTATIWDINVVKAVVLRSSPADDHLIGYAGPDRIDGKEGNDVIEGRGGRDMLFGGAGDDALDGGEGGDFLIGGPGDDRLLGGAGSDHYFFALDSGHDLVVSDGNAPDDRDGVHLGEGIDETNLWLRRVDDDLLLSVTGTTDSLAIKDWFAGAAAGFANFELTNNKSLAPARVDALVAIMSAMDVASSTRDGPSAARAACLALGQSKLDALIESSWVVEPGTP